MGSLTLFGGLIAVLCDMFSPNMGYIFKSNDILRYLTHHWNSKKLKGLKWYFNISVSTYKMG